MKNSQLHNYSELCLLSKELVMFCYINAPKTIKRYCLLSFITARKRSLRRLCFYRCLSVHTGGRVWLLPGGLHGCSGGACVVAPGGGACVVAPGERVWLLPGGMRGIRWDKEIRLMSGRYASYWNAFLFEIVSHIWLLQFLIFFCFAETTTTIFTTGFETQLSVSRSSSSWEQLSVDDA